MLKDQIKEDLKQAMLARNEEALLPLRMLVSEIKNMEISKGGAGYEANEEDIVSVVEKQIKQRKESAEAYKNADRAELAAKEEKEIGILSKYLPEQLSEAEIDRLVAEAVSQSGASTAADMGKVMGLLMPKVKGKADGGLVSQKVKDKLG